MNEHLNTEFQRIWQAGSLNPTADRTIQKQAAQVPSILSPILSSSKTPEDYEPISLLNKLKQNPYFKLIDFGYDEVNKLAVCRLEYKENIYDFNLSYNSFQMSDLLRLGHQLSEENNAELNGAKYSLVTQLFFNEDVLTSYHLQLKIAYTLVPDMIALADESAYKVYSPLWTKLAACSQIPPSPGYLFLVHAIKEDKKKWFPVSESKRKVWLHTHGLNRCGIPDLDILNSSEKFARSHYDLLNTMAIRMINDGGLEEASPIFLANTMSGNAIVGTWVKWDTARKEYKKNLLGGECDRDEYDHKKDNGFFFLYLTPEDAENKKLTQVTIIPENEFENLLVMISDEETLRMSLLARERFNYLVKGLQLHDAHAIVKIAIHVDEDKKEEAGSDYEHIWFEVKNIEGEELICELLQEPYFVKKLQVGTKKAYTLNELTDWILYLPDQTIQPDTAYIIDVITS